MLTYNEATEELSGFFSGSEEWLPTARSMADEAEKACTTYLEGEIQPHIKGLGEEEIETLKAEKGVFEYDALIERFEGLAREVVTDELDGEEMARTYDSLRRDW